MGEGVLSSFPCIHRSESLMPHETHQPFLARAVELATENVGHGGGPFGAVVVKDGRIVAGGANRVTASNDPTAHAEIVAVRAACEVLGSFQLEGCDVYCSCEPCPMCLGALYWARVRTVYFAATSEDAAGAGFDDRFIYEEIARPPHERAMAMVQVEIEGAKKPFARWKDAPRRTRY